MPWTGPAINASSKDDIISALISHKEARQKIREQVNVLELWEMSQGEVTEESAEFFAGLMESEVTPDTAASYAHALLEYKNHFKFQNPLF